MKLDKEDLDAIGAAVVAALKAGGASITPPTGEGKAAGKPAGKPKATGPKREDVLAKVRELGAAKGKDVAKAEVAKFAEAFGDVKDEDLGKLLKAVEEALAAEAAPAEAADDF